MAITVTSPFWNNTYSILNNTNNARNRVTQAMRKPGMRVIKELIDELIGATTGGTAAITHKQVLATSQVGVAAGQGGVVSIETVTDINRATVTADVTDLELMINVATKPSSYPVDASGNNPGGRFVS